MLKPCPRACSNDDEGKWPVAKAKQDAMGITTSCSNESRRLEAMVYACWLCPRVVAAVALKSLGVSCLARRTPSATRLCVGCGEVKCGDAC